MSLINLVLRALGRAPEPRRKVEFQRITPQAGADNVVEFPNFEVAPPAERPVLAARMIEVKGRGTYGRNAVEPLPKRRGR